MNGCRNDFGSWITVLRKLKLNRVLKSCTCAIAIGIGADGVILLDGAQR